MTKTEFIEILDSKQNNFRCWKRRVVDRDDYWVWFDAGIDGMMPQFELSDSVSYIQHLLLGPPAIPTTYTYEEFINKHLK